MDKLKKFTEPIGVFLDRFIEERKEHFLYDSVEFSELLRDIVLASKIIHREINRAGVVGIDGVAGQTNVQGEDQKMLDVVAHLRFVNALSEGKQVCGIVSEEEENFIDTNNNDAKYVISMDPLDGSSNIQVNMTIGTIFSVFRRVSPVGSPPTKEDFLQKGNKQVAAGYVIYGSSTMLVFTTGNGVNGFTYEPSLGEFILSYPDMTINPEGSIISINQENFLTFPEGVKDYVKYCRKEQYRTIYTGSLVADFHRNLFTGGIYIYASSEKYIHGKLRLLYECMPLAFIAEQAGGDATDGQQRIMEIIPTEFHQRAPFFIGSKKLVEKAMSYTK